MVNVTPYIENWNSLLFWALAQIKDDNLRKIIIPFCCDETVRPAPASRHRHHNFPGGYIMHVAEMLAIAKEMSQSVFYSALNWEVICAGILLHDIGKLQAYQKNQFSSEYEYTLETQMLDHVNMSLIKFTQLLLDYPIDDNLRIAIMHCIVSHHGRKEWGSNVEPKTKEAWLVHLVDMISSRTTMFVDNGDETKA